MSLPVAFSLFQVDEDNEKMTKKLLALVDKTKRFSGLAQQLFFAALALVFLALCPQVPAYLELGRELAILSLQAVFINAAT